MANNKTPSHIRRKLATTHGKSFSSEYNSWRGMLYRCYNTKAPGYHRYGGRGITVCDRWLNSFENFYADMGDKPINAQIERINNDGNYEPSNCKWATIKEQANNRRTNTHIVIDGVKITISEFANKVGISCDTMCRRIYKYKYSEEELKLPLGSKRKKKKPRETTKI